jgi:hypothetical protein
LTKPSRSCSMSLWAQQRKSYWKDREQAWSFP